MSRWLLFIASLNGFLVVMLGAFGAHLIRGQVNATLHAAWQTAVEYQATHGLVLLVLGVYQSQRWNRLLERAVWALMLGILLFSGSLYLMVLSQWHGLGAVTPFGGILLLSGWVLLAVDAWRRAQGR